VKVRIGQLWKIPVFCLTAGYLTFYAAVFFTARFAVVHLPDGSVTSDFNMTAVINTVFFILSLLVSRPFLRGMTTKERFLSATIQVAILLLFLLLEPGIMLNAYITEWSRPISLAGFLLTRNVYVGAALNCFSPYLLILRP
jgi:hypothetical protein